MLKLAKERPDDDAILVFDVRPKNIALETFRKPKVFLGRILPLPNDRFRWESAWGAHSGEAADIDAAQGMIAKCATGMYR